MRYDAIDSKLFVENRKRLAARLKGNSIAIFNSNDLMPRNGDQFFYYRQNSDLFYLTGIAQEDTILIMFPDFPEEKYRELLFVKKTSKTIEIWEGPKLSLKEASSISGIETVFWLESFERILKLLMQSAAHCYLNRNENERFTSLVPYKDLRFAEEMHERFPLHQYERAAPILAALRSIKSETELDLLRRACDITDKALRRVLGFIKPGKKEYEIEAEMIHEFLSNGASLYAYEPIVASGKNACILHYVKNSDVCNDGDILLMDFGAEYAHYNADLSRTVPVNGRFTDRQRAVYNATLRIFYETRQLLRPGILMAEYNKEVGKIAEKELVSLGLLDRTDLKNQDPAHPLYKEYFLHGNSHFLGIDVHDVADSMAPLSEGMVLTVEPGIYIKDEELGVRIENNIVVTDGDPLDLMGSIPIEADDIEALMNSHSA